MCRLVMGNKTQALQEITTATALCRQHPWLLETHGPQLHTLLGLYSMSMNCMDAAEAQFTAALTVGVCLQHYKSFCCTNMLWELPMEYIWCLVNCRMTTKVAFTLFVVFETLNTLSKY